MFNQNRRNKMNSTRCLHLSSSSVIFFYDLFKCIIIKNILNCFNYRVHFNLNCDKYIYALFISSCIRQNSLKKNQYEYYLFYDTITVQQ